MAEATSTAQRVTRYGWMAKGLIFAVIGVLGLDLARRGYTGEPADQTGALAALSDIPLGRVLVFAVGLGLALFAAWQFWSAAVAASDSLLDVLRRLGSAFLGMAYALLAVSALEIAARGTRPTSNGQSLTSPDGITSRLFDLPLGRIVVVGIGLVVVAVGIYHLQKGWRGEFLDDVDRSGLSDAQIQALRVAGVAGFTARALMLGIAGSLFVTAARDHDADEAAGIDQSLRTLLEAPAGRVLLAAAATGLLVAGVYDAITFRRQQLGDS